MKRLNKFYPHFLAVAGFILVSLIYFYPVLQGKKIFQSDIAQFTGMAKEQNDFRAANHTEPYWTNSAFGGMPTYQLGANYPHDYIGKLDDMLRFLPRPADYLFLYFLGFYALMLVLKADPLKAFFGALAFGFSTYLIIILGVGHNAKAHAIAYMPLVVAGVLLVFKRKYVAGGLLTMVAAALEINANHFQMTYYLLFLLLAITIYYCYKYISEKSFRQLLYAFGVFAVAGILAIGVNAANLLATSEYANDSIRGKSELTYNPDGTTNTTKSAMDYDYITEYSYGIAESLNLIAPRLFGGGNGEDLGPDSAMYELMINNNVPEHDAREGVKQLPVYWGDQPIVEAPAYIGAVVFFFCILALFNDQRKLKYAFLAGAILSLFLSWGKNFPELTNFFIDHVPMYDKFRAVSSIQVILELCIPVLAIMGLQSFFKSDSQTQLKSLYKSAGTFFGIILVLFLFKSQFTFAGMHDDMMLKQYGPQFIEALKSDRKTLYSADLARSAFLVLICTGMLWLVLKNKLAQNTAIIIIGIVMVADLFFVDKKYVNAEDFVSASQVDIPFEASAADQQILQDKSDFRVYDIQGRLQGKSSYFHKTVGGYSAVRPRRFEELFKYQIDKDLPAVVQSTNEKTLTFTKNSPVLDLLNVKYVIIPVESGEVPLVNPYANGNAWFVSSLKTVASADDEMKSLDKIDSKNTAVVNTKEFPNLNLPQTLAKDSTANIVLKSYNSNTLKYESDNVNAGVAVFSEMYYKKGWNAFIDGKKADHFRADYVLRAMQVPAGKHTIEFKFEPEVVKTGGAIALASSVGMLFLIAGGLYFERRKYWYKDQK
ncbi:membrane protein [Flavobacterium noncentrifugens]|uniref:Membrane protein YfhO n=1 Tax=Flavobacterium noncentrifugens TaxID=1128970 RepID=A0A1G8YIF5_9FLAO|nr:YfhO family protein [Flavobacterium noncentrifugens]GEP51241.1 membrane protein [Flavobacterium noncentrifugens]SDK02669.1 membrane protein YfhO [Flavobacterium noncentrifugens]